MDALRSTLTRIGSFDFVFCIGRSFFDSVVGKADSSLSNTITYNEYSHNHKINKYSENKKIKAEGGEHTSAGGQGRFWGCLLDGGALTSFAGLLFLELLRDGVSRLEACISCFESCSLELIKGLRVDLVCRFFSVRSALIINNVTH